MTFKTQFLHFDSASSRYITDLYNTSTVSNNPYKAVFPMNQTFSRIKRVYLSTVEMPVGFSNIRTGSTDTLIFALNGTTYLITLPEKNYTSISVLLTDINTLIASKISGVTMTFSSTTSLTTPYRILITFSGSTTTTSFVMTDTTLSKYILGFRGLTDTLVGGIYNALSANWTLTPDNYINMYIPSLNGMNSSMNGQISTFKIPLNTFTGQVYYYQEGNSFRQWVDITDTTLSVSSLTVFISDKFGKNISPNGMDYSFTLSLEIWD